MTRLDPVAEASSGVNRMLAMGLGLLLGITTLRTAYVGTSTDFASRVVPVDLVCLALLGMLFMRHRMAPVPPSGMLYATAIVASLIPGLLITPGPAREVWVGAAALFMAFGFYLAGLNVAQSPALLYRLLAGLCIGVGIETVIVVHDAVSPAQWFPDPMPGRVRGTFKANGQLGAYGFCAAGILLTFGATLGPPRLRRFCVVAAIAAASFVYLASRRTGMITVFLWAGIFAVLGWRFARERYYRVFLGALVAASVLLTAFWPEISDSFAGRRLVSGIDGLLGSEGFIQGQMIDVLQTADAWFPFGFGAARGYHINTRSLHEVHNGLLAVAVELGILGLAGFLGMMAGPILRRPWSWPGRDRALRGILQKSFLLSCFVFVLHNTLYRDRTFLLFLGIATVFSRRESMAAGREPGRMRAQGALA